MDNISKFLSNNPKYKRLSKPLTAARVCEAAGVVGNTRFRVVSFRDGLLTVSVKSASVAGNLQMELQEIRDEINQKIGQELVQKMRIKIG